MKPDNVVKIPRVGLSIDEAVEYLRTERHRQITKQSLYNKIYLDEGPAHRKQGNRLRFSTADLDRWDIQTTEVRGAFTG